MSASVIAQVDEEIKEKIEMKSYYIDNDLGERIKKEKFKVDTIKIKSERYKNKIANKILFRESGVSIDLDIYFENDSILMIRTTEESRNFKSYENAIQVTMLYFRDGIKIDEKIRTGIPKGLHGIGFPQGFDSNNVYGYDKNFKPEFIMKLSNQILKQIKE